MPGMPKLKGPSAAQVAVGSMARAYSSVVEHYVDIVGVGSSILPTPTIETKNAKGIAQAVPFSYPHLTCAGATLC